MHYCYVNIYIYILTVGLKIKSFALCASSQKQITMMSKFSIPLKDSLIGLLFQQVQGISVLYTSLAWQVLDALLCLVDSTISRIRIMVAVICTSLQHAH